MASSANCTAIDGAGHGRAALSGVVLIIMFIRTNGTLVRSDATAFARVIVNTHVGATRLCVDQSGEEVFAHIGP